MFKLRKLEDRIVLDGAGAFDALGEADAHEVHDSMMHDAQNGQDIHDGDYGIDGQEPLYTADGTDFTDDGGVHVLVISSDINDADDLETAAKDGVIVVRYDASGTTMENLSGLISDALDGREANTIAFATHNAALDSLESDADQQAFWQAVGTMIAEGGRIDLLACNAVEDEAGEAFVAKIEELSGTDVAASADPTGNGAYGGDWVLESDGVDIQSTYFDADRLENFDGVMQNTQPVIQNNNPLNISAETFGVINQELLLVTDPDSADWAGALTYTLSTVPNDGTLFFDVNGSGTVDGNETVLQAGHKFTQAQIYTDRLTYLHNGARDTTETFQFNVTDSSGAATGYETFTINVTQNVNPVIVANDGMTVVENSFGVINGSDLAVEDGDNTTDNLTYTLNAPLPQHGTLWFDDNLNGEIDGNEVALDSSQNNTFTQDQLNENKLTYRHNGLYQGPILDSFNFTVKDDNTAGSANGVFRITISEVNDAPAEVEVGEITAVHEPVNISSVHLNFTDADNSPYYLTYTLETTPEYGELYLLDRGEDGILNTDDDTISYIGEGNTFTQTDVNFGRLHFVRNTVKGYEDVADAFTFTVSDPDGTFATNEDDGTETFTFNVTVKDVNENPYIFINDAIKVNEDGSVAISSEFLTARDPDKTDGPENLTYKITGLGEHIDDDGIVDIPFNGTLHLYTDDTQSTLEWSLKDEGDLDLSNYTFTQEDIDNGNLVYEYDSVIDDYDRVEFKFRVYDDGDTDGSVNAYGESLALDSGELTFAINVTNENDRPELQTNELLTVVEDQDDEAITESYLRFDDVDNSSKELTYTLVTVPDKGVLYIDSDLSGSMDGEEAALAIDGTFTQEDIEQNRLKYAFGGNEPLNDNPDTPDYSFTFTVKDEGTSDDTEPKYALVDPNGEDVDANRIFQFDIEVTGVNDKPVLSDDYALIRTVTGDEFDQYIYIVNDDVKMQIYDAEDASTEVLKYRLTQNANDGLLFIDKDNPDRNGKLDYPDEYEEARFFSQEQLDQGRLMFKYNLPSQPATTDEITFKFEVYDGIEFGDEVYTFTIRIIGTNSLPELATNKEMTMTENTTLSLRNYLDATDEETYDGDLKYTITEIPERGFLFYDNDDSRTWDDGDTKLVIGSDFKQEDLDRRKIYYRYDSDFGGEGDETALEFKFTLEDDDGEKSLNGEETFIIKVTGIDSGSELKENNTLDMPEDTIRKIENDLLLAVDPDYDPTDYDNYHNVTYILEGLPENSNSFLFIDRNGDGEWDSSEKIIVDDDNNNTFTQKNIDDGELYYYNDNEPPDPDDVTFEEKFTFAISDVSGSLEFNISVTANANDVPRPDQDTTLSFINDDLQPVTMEGEDSKSYIQEKYIKFTDGDTNDPLALEYELVEAPKYGQLLSGDADNGTLKEYGVGHKFSITDFNGLSVYYQHSGSEETEDYFKIVVYDSDEGDQSVQTKITIPIVNTNDTPDLKYNVMTVAEGDANVTIEIGDPETGVDPETGEVADLFVSDPDSEAGSLVYTITDMTNINGILYLDETELTVEDGEFTQQDIIDGRLTYSHNADSEVPLASFTFKVTDSDADDPKEITDQTFNINVTPVNDRPELETGGDYLKLIMSENDKGDRGELTIGKDILLTTDNDLFDDNGVLDESSPEIVYTITKAPIHGKLWTINDNEIDVLETGDTFTQNQVSSNVIYYWHDGAEPEDSDITTPDDSFDFSVTDSGIDGKNEWEALNSPNTVNIYIEPVNDKPELINSSVTVIEDSATHISDTELMATDDDDVSANLVFTLDTTPKYGYLFFDDGDGQWNGEDKLDIGSTFTQSDITNGKLTFQHVNEGYDVYEDSFKFQVADDDDGIATDQTFTINVTNVDDTPEITSKGLTVWEGEGIGLNSRSGVIDGNKLYAFDGDDGPDNLIYTITSLGVDDDPLTLEKDESNPFSGTLFFDNNGNGEYDFSHDTKVGIGSQFTQTDINKGALTFEHNGDDQLKETFGFTVNDLNFSLTEQSFYSIPDNSIPEKIIDDLKVLENDVYKTKEEFITALEDLEEELEEEQIIEYKSEILKYASYPVNEAEGTFEINVFGVNDNPELKGPFSSAEVVNAVGGETLNFNGVSAELISIDDPDAGLGKMTVLIDLKPGANEESVGRISADLNIDGAYVEKTSSFIAIEGDRDAVNKVLATLTFTPDSDYTGKAYIAFEVLDNGNIGQGGEGHDSGTLTIDVAEGEPAAPTATNSAASAAEDMIYTFQTSDFNFNESVEGIFVIPVSANGELQLFTDDGWKEITDPTQDPITVADINAGKLRFEPDENENLSGYSQFQFRVYNDLGDGTRVYAESTNTMTIDVMPINDAPENNVPGPQLVKVGTFLEFNGNNMIQIKDVDSDNTITPQHRDYENEFTVTLQVGNGILSGLDSSDATVDGNGTSLVKVTGTLSEVNAELSDLKYSSETLGADTLTITTNDWGNSGGVALQDVDIVLIKITESDVTGGGTLPEEALRMNSSSPFTYQFDEFAANFPADSYEITGKPDWLVFKEESRTFYYVKGITGTAVSGTYEIEVTAYYDQSGTAITDTLTIEVAGMDRGVFNALQLLDDTQEYIIPADSETVEVQEVMMASAAMADNAVNTEMIEALKLIESGMMA
ncbi:MAG: DUF4347 domain-containing protein [Desulfobacterales bacterium]|nr:DUF4347 domain-containing protein [Desulfobacterales bacterium]